MDTHCTDAPLGYADDVVVIEKGGQEGVPRLTKGVTWVEDRN